MNDRFDFFTTPHIETENPMLAPRVKGDTCTTDVVQGLPAVVRGASPPDKATLLRYAVMCLMGEKVDMTTFQVYWLNRAFHELSPSVFTFAEHLVNVVRTPGVAKLVTKQCMENLKINTWALSDMEEHRILMEMEHIGQALADHGNQIERLAGALPVAEWDGQGYFMDLECTTFYQLIEYAGFEPITAAKFLMITRPCEHVMLTETMLRWSNHVPPVCGLNENRRVAPHPYPSVAPLDPHEYSKYEYYVRRQQRLFFPGRTSAECHLIINTSGAYETQQVLDTSNRDGQAIQHHHAGGSAQRIQDAPVSDTERDAAGEDRERPVDECVERSETMATPGEPPAQAGDACDDLPSRP